MSQETRGRSRGPGGARRRWTGAVLAVAAALTFGLSGAPARASAGAGAGGDAAGAVAGAVAGGVAAAFASAAEQYGVPQPVLEAVCYLEGRLSAHGGSASVDGGYGCMHLLHNHRVDTLDQAAALTGASVDVLEHDTAASIRGGAAVLRAEALGLSADGALPSSLAEWYAPIAAYSHASSRRLAGMYADAAFQVVNQGFQAPADDGELITLAGRAVTPDRAGLRALGAEPDAVPAGCKQDSNVDYPGAVDCVVAPAQFDCNVTSPCTYQSSTRPTSYAINMLTIHDVEGSAQDALNVFQDPSSAVSAHYVVGGDGTVYQVIRDKDIAYHAGNFYYNEHAIGIENAGFDASGYQWYNATEYLASAKLAAYLMTKYHLPLDRAHVTAHGTTPSPTVGSAPNHVDPGTYWLWDYYMGLIHAQGVAYPTGTAPAGVYRVSPASDQAPLGANGTETSANTSFFSLYQGPSTASGLIPHNPNADSTDETSNIEAYMPFYAIASQADGAGTGMTMYEVWYGENDKLSGSSPSWADDAALAWLAVPAGSAVPAIASEVRMTSSNRKATTVSVYGRPTTSSSYVIGSAPNGALFASVRTVVEDGTSNTWYQIDFNHREAWVKAADVTVVAHP